jgi:Tol biopolymer transport system component
MVVEENNVYQAISMLRRALGDGFIATVPGRGYQFVGDVRTISDAAEGKAESAAVALPPATADVSEVTVRRSPVHRRSQVSGAVSTRRRVRWVWAAAIGASAVLIGALLAMFGQALRIAPLDAGRPVQFVVQTPEWRTFGWVPSNPEPAVSPDGRSLAFIAPFESRAVVWIQTLGDLEARPVKGTEGAVFPFWSSDGRFIGFGAGARVKRIAATGTGVPQDVMTTNEYWGGTWARDGSIVFAGTLGLHRVSSDGGDATRLTRIDNSRGEISHRFPVMLPDNRRFLYLILSTQEEHQGLYLGSLDEPQKKQRVVGTDANAAFATSPDGREFLLFVRDFTLLAQPFDAVRGELTGNATVLARPIEPAPSVRFAPFAASGRVIVYRPRFRPDTRLVWMDRRGIVRERLGVEGERYSEPSLSPDGTKLVVMRLDRATETEEVWWFDLRRQVSERLTATPFGAYNPTWMPDESAVVYAAPRGGVWGLYRRAITGGGDEKPLFAGLTPPQKFVRDVTRDGRYLLFEGRGVENDGLWVLPLGGEGRPYVLMDTPSAETHGQVSPDGRWLAYTSNETGESQVYVTAFPAPGERWRISTSGGQHPQWRGDGRELYYVATDLTLMAVAMGDVVSFGTQIPEPLFRMSPDPLSFRFGSAYAPEPGGRQFLVIEVDKDDKPQLIVTLNWTL